MNTGRLLLLSAALTSALVLASPADVPAGAAPAAAPAAESGGLRFDRAGLAAEMSALSGDLKRQPTEALQGHIRRLTEQYEALGRSDDLSPSERRSLGEGILARVAQVSLLLRERMQPRPEGAAKGGEGRLAAFLGWLGALVLDGPALLLGLVGGVVIAFALGSLAGYRRGATHASYYGSEGDPRIRFLSRSVAPGDNGGEPGRVSATQLRDMLARGRTVMLQLGYEIAEEHRPRYLELIGEIQASMEGLEGQSYTVWEDPRHLNRFYELLVCFRPEALDRLIDRDRRLAGIAAEIEACRAPRGPVFRRAWWELPPSAAHRE